MRARRRVSRESGHGVDERPLARRRRPGRLRAFDHLSCHFDRLGILQPAERVPPHGKRNAPVRHRAGGIFFEDLVERGRGLGEPEGVQERHAFVEIVTHARRARRLERDMPGADVVRRRAAGMFVLRPHGGWHHPGTEAGERDNEQALHEVLRETRAGKGAPSGTVPSLSLTSMAEVANVSGNSTCLVVLLARRPDSCERRYQEVRQSRSETAIEIETRVVREDRSDILIPAVGDKTLYFVRPAPKTLASRLG